MRTRKKTSYNPTLSKCRQIPPHVANFDSELNEYVDRSKTPAEIFQELAEFDLEKFLEEEAKADSGEIPLR